MNSEYPMQLLVKNIEDNNQSFELSISIHQIEKKLKDYINFEHKCWTDEGLVGSPEWEERCPLLVSAFSSNNLLLENMSLKRKQMEAITTGDNFGSERIPLENMNFTLAKGAPGIEVEWRGMKYLLTLQ